MMIDFLSNPRLSDYDLSSLRRGVAAAARRCPRRVAQKLLDADRAAVHGRLRPVRNHRRHPYQPAAAAQEAMPGHSATSTPIRASSIPATMATLPPGEVGEIIMHGPQVFQGYWNAAGKATEEAFIEHRRQALLPHRRPGLLRRGRLLLHHRPPEAHDQLLAASRSGRRKSKR